MDFESLSLAELFDQADRIGDKYLSAQEIEQRDWQWAELAEEIGYDCEQQSFARGCRHPHQTQKQCPVWKTSALLDHEKNEVTKSCHRIFNSNSI